MIRDAADRNRTLVELMAEEADLEPPASTVPLERPSQNGVYRGRCKVRVIPPGVGRGLDETFLFGSGARVSGPKGRETQRVRAAERRGRRESSAPSER